MATKSKRTASKTKNESTSEEDDLLMTEEPEVTVSIEDLPGVGPATAEKLREAGFDELLAIAVMSPSELAEQAKCTVHSAPGRRRSATNWS